MRIINRKHPALNYPNKINLEDFNGWVQERGLYFPNSWSQEYETIISSNDEGEKPNNGGILISKVGEGYFVYTSYSWFRQLPASQMYGDIDNNSLPRVTWIISNKVRKCIKSRELSPKLSKNTLGLGSF